MGRVTVVAKNTTRVRTTPEQAHSMVIRDGAMLWEEDAKGIAAYDAWLAQMGLPARKKKIHQALKKEKNDGDSNQEP